ncbi:MAG: hypothetical protein LC746_06270 [Acidobacteria bacterium]|nr:hypothetical protein [Acidobacteriota bacterium]
MSDYLWDKTGEAEEDVERLEGLLGQLRFQPRTFEVPAIMPFAPRRTVARKSFTWPRLAVAASLLLALLAGAWLVATKQRTNGTPQIAHAPANGAITNPTQQPTAPQPGKDQSASVATNVGRHQRHEFVPGAPKRLAAPPRQSNAPGVSVPREEIATNLSPEERAAMAKFLLAMRVTSEKLNYAERQVASVNR